MLTQEESDSQLLARSVRDLASRTRFPVAFGGWQRADCVRISSVVGNRTRSLDGLSVQTGRGLGGRAMTELRPRMTPDYRSARQITHDYDGQVLGEGIGALLAVPVVVDGVTRAVLYGGAWSTSSVGDVTAAAAFQVADSLASELRVREEVHRRLQRMQPATERAEPLGTSAKEQLRESYAQLRSIASGVTDPMLRERLLAVERQLAQLSGSGDTDGAHLVEPISDVRLSPREIDVLACAALGATNAQIATTLGLREGTVKAYLGAAMGKLDASTRHAAVARARRVGLLP